MGNCLCRRPSRPPPPLPGPGPALPPETAQCIHPTSIPLSNVSYPLGPFPFMASSSQGSRRKPTHSTTPHNDDAMTSIPSHKVGAVRRAHAQSQDAASLHHRRHGGTNDLPSSSEGDVSTSQHLDRQEMRLRQFPSGGTGPMQWTRSVSMDVTAFQSAPSPSSSRRNGTASTTVYGSGHRRVGTQSMTGLPPATIQITAGRQRGRPRFHSALQSLLPNNFRYAVRP